LSVVFLICPALGTDLAAAVARGDFVAQAPLRPLDFRWYSGVSQFGYSIFAQYIIAASGAKVAGAVSASVAALALHALLRCTAVARPTAGALVGTLCIFANLVSGRITYSIGLALGLLALLAVSHGRVRLGTATAAAAAAASPVAGLFVGMIGVALMLSRHRRPGAALSVGASVPLAVVGLAFGQGGTNTMSWADTYKPALLCLAVIIFVRHPAVRVAAMLSAAGLLAAFLLPTPVGLNATRLPVMFAVTTIIACSRVRSLIVLPVVAALLAWLPPLAVGDWRARGDVTASARYFEPLLMEIERLGRDGRVEIPPLRNYWDAVYAAREVPLARGWLRQLDTKRHSIFFDGTLTAETYEDWLADNAVQYVAVAAAPASWVGRAEADLVQSGVPYLALIWSNSDWRLYQVRGHVPLVEAPGRLTYDQSDRLVFTVPRAGAYRIDVAASRWLVLEGPGCLEQTPGAGEVVVRSRSAGSFTLTSDLRGASRDNC
jgi:hypothetical protein